MPALKFPRGASIFGSYRQQARRRNFFTCTCGGIHPERVEPASPTELTTSRIEALQARHSPRPFSIVRSRRLAVQVCLGRGCTRRQLASSSPASRARQCWQKVVPDHLTIGTSHRVSTGRRSSTVGAQSCCRCQRPPAPFHRLLVLAFFSLTPTF